MCVISTFVRKHQNIPLPALKGETAPADEDGAVSSGHLADTASSDLAFDPVPVASRSDGWSPLRQRGFIEELADCGIVREAAARVGMTEQSANRLRRRPDAHSFRLAWDAAIRLGGERLRSVAFDRAVNGTVRRRYYHGKVIDEERVYDNRLLVYLLGRHPSTHPPGSWNQEAFLAAAQHRLPMPSSASAHNAPVWKAKDGRWYTNFPPPKGFAGEQEGSFGEPNYLRDLSAEEQAMVDAAAAGERAKGERARDLYFENLPDFFSS